ncbi:hypothetical protein FKP32DRAFT_1606300 [Trametes sanguinea]|nr:hypothetical protein FKP32DRAFT_1606300 [Trametes sanguinea]
MFFQMFQLLSFVVAFVVALPTLSYPIHLTGRDAVSPPITKPIAGAVWKVGEVQTVTWDGAALDGAPPSNPLGKVLLGTIDSDGQEHLMWETPLITGFPILGGNVSLTVPSVPAGDNYIVCLLGTSDDISPPFTILAADS